MNKLVHAGLSRIFRSRIFWLCFAVALLIAMGNVWAECRQLVAEGGVSDTGAEKAIFQVVPYMMFLCAALVSLFTGTEFSDGTLRNKVIVGHTRRNIYLANFIVSAIASSVILLAALVVGMVIGIPTLGPCASWPQALYIGVCSLFICIALSALCTLLVMTSGSKATGAVLCFTLSLVLLVGGSALEGQLSEPEMAENYVSINEYGQPTTIEEMPNPLYVGGTMRQVLRIICDALPTGQAAQISNMDMERPECFIPLSIAFAALCTLGGLAVFKRKNLR